MHGSAFSRVVGEVTLAGGHDATHAGDDDHRGGAGRVFRASDGGLEEGKKREGSEVD